MKCLRCGPLIKAIDAYLAKAENDLYEQLTMEGYLKAKESLNTVDEIEEVVTKLLEDNADDLLKELADAIDLETFFKDNWPKFKNKSKLARDLFDVFHTQFSTIMPTYVEAYVQKTDAELTVTKLTKRTTDWISSWSSDLADIMKLDTETEIEAVLKKGLNDGKGINDVANLIADSGIRSPGYRARRVALTEVLRAHGYAQLESYIQSPAVEEKMWKHTGAYRNDPRQNHVDMDGVRVPKGQPFTLIGADGNTYYPMTPRDVCLPPRESVNCHCLLQPVVSEEVLGLSLEERQALQAQAIAEDDGEWEKELDAQNKARRHQRGGLHVKVTIDEARVGKQPILKIDGIELANIVNGYTLHHDAGQLATLELRIAFGADLSEIETLLENPNVKIIMPEEEPHVEST